MGNDSAPNVQQPAAQVSMADALAGGLVLHAGMHPELSTVRERARKDDASGGDVNVASAFPPNSFTDPDSYEPDSDDDVDEGGDGDGYDAWAVTDDAGQDLAGLSVPVFDVVVADDVADLGDYYG